MSRFGISPINRRSPDNLAGDAAFFALAGVAQCKDYVMKTLIAAAMLISATAIGAPAMAQQPTGYATLGYTHLDNDNVGVGEVDARLGLRFGRYVGVEGEAGQAVGFLPVSPRLDLLARVGYGTERFDTKIAGFGHTTTDTSVNYGVGAQYFLSGADGVRLDYTRKDVSNSRADDYNAYSVAYVRRF
jgi:outer membrane immunogenic protein